jgi:nicotinate-nucleotide adenylyltransferase
MTRLAAEASPFLEALDLEGRRPGLSYSIETLRELRRHFGPGPDLFFILGMDAFLEIETWKEYLELFDYAHFVVIQRPGYGREALGPLLTDLGLEAERGKQPNRYTAPSGTHLILMQTTLMDISATDIRNRLAAGRSIVFLVPPAIHTYIRDRELYQKHGSPS